MAGTIVFAHANGFPAGVYRQVFEAWRAAGWQVHAPERIGHDPRFPVSSGWPHLRDELLDFTYHVATGPVWLVGHSMGGYLCLLAASRRPEIARGVVLLDAPIVAGLRAALVRLSKTTGLGERFSPAHLSKRRREHWPSREAAHAHFAAKRAFAAWAPGVLDDYIACGMEPHADGLRLAFRRETETAIFRSLPHHLARLLRAHPLACPVAFVAGRDSEENRRAGLAASRRIASGKVSTIAGGHLFPMERPGETAAEVLRWIARLDDAGA
jgi:pimeloyl-ACP methyl ester carboxylesterase